MGIISHLGLLVFRELFPNFGSQNTIVGPCVPPWALLLVEGTENGTASNRCCARVCQYVL